AAEHVSGARSYPDRPGQRVLDDGPDVFVDDALVPLLPGFAPILADEEACLRCACVQSTLIVHILHDRCAHDSHSLEADGASIELAIFLLDEVEAIGGAGEEDAIGSAHAGLLHLPLPPLRGGLGWGVSASLLFPRWGLYSPKPG